MAFLKPQNPMTKGSDYFYPLTTADQVIMDGGYRLDEIVGKTKKSTIMLYANGWSAEVPYCYSVAVQGLSDKVNMKMLPHFPEDFEGKQAMKEETAKISFATREGNILTFECWDEVPTMDLPIDIEIEAMYPIKGASIEMNYSVVGGVEEPAEPTENMIWVNTDQDITDWVFSKNEPKNPEEGMIWFATGDNGNISFFTLRMDKREFDEVYPISAKQYAGGAWMDVAAKSYLSGAWVEWWDGYYYRAGNEYENITGGWIIKEKKGTKNGTLGTLTKQEDGLVINLTGNSCGACLRTEEKVDLTDIKKISIAWFFDSGSISGGSFFVTDSISVGEWDWNNKAVTSGDVLNLSSADIDVSALQGEFYVCLSVDYAHGNTPATTKLRVTEVGTV